MKRHHLFQFPNLNKYSNALDVEKLGNSINLVAELYNIRNIEAAKLINKNLGLGIEFREKGVKIKKGSDEFKTNIYEERQKMKQEFQKWQEKTFIILSNYLDILKMFEKIEDFENDLFVEALQNKDYIEYLIDEYFINGTEKDRVELWKYKRRELNEYESKLRLYGRIS